MDYSRWMSLNRKIHTKKLANICLPMTHDSGTFDLSDVPANEPLAEIENLVNKVMALLNKIDVLPNGEDPVYFVEKDVTKSVKGLATATKQNIATQLRRGVRGFDFRLLNVDGTYYIHHGLRSTSTFESMLDDIRAFLTETSNAKEQVGEIVYVNLSHYEDFKEHSDYTNFGDLVKKKLGDWAYLNTGSNDPFKATYKEIIGQGGTNKSRVILVSETDLGDSKTFWPVNYCPPVETRTQNLLAGEYTDSTDVDKVTKTQVSQFKSALGKTLPFANYMTLTPSTFDYVNIIAANLHKAFTVLAEDLKEEPDLAAIAEAVADLLWVDYVATAILGFMTLEQLAHRINKDLPEVVDDNFVPLMEGDTNQISMIFGDFFEESQLVDVSIALSNDFEMVWTGNSKIKIDGTEPRSDEGPCAVKYEGLLYMFYKGLTSNDIWMASYDPKKSAWISNQKIRDMPGGIKPQTSKSPAAAIYNGILYVVFKGHDGDTVRAMSWNGNEWAGGEKIQTEDGTYPQTNNSPYLAVYDGEMHLVHKWKDSDDIHWTRFNNGKWHGGAKIEVTDNKEKHPGTNKRPALVVYGGKLQLLFKASHTNRLDQCTYDGKSWTGNRPITDRAEKFHPKSDEGPGVARFAEELYMLYKGEAYDDIWQSINNGLDWFEDVKLKDVTSIAPKSNRSPWVVRCGIELLLLNSGDKDYLHMSSFRPVHF